MVQFPPFISLILKIILVFNLRKNTPVIVDARFFEHELPNRTVTICPNYSFISLECPQIPSMSDHPIWQSKLPNYLISIEYIRSFPLRLGFDARSCQPDLSHACNNYDLRYINTLCNGKPQCSDISSYQIRERSLCTFKAVTEIGFRCVPTWNLREIQIKYDICQNTSLINDYGFIYSRNYPSNTVRMICHTTIYAKPNHKVILYFVNGELNHDQLRIESETSNSITILNITLNGNLTTQNLAATTYKMKLTFIPSHIYSYHPTYYLLYFYSIPICSITNPCLPRPSTLITLPTTATSRMRIQSIGWTHISNIWIVIPTILAYMLLLLLIIVLAFLFRRRRKQQKVVEDIRKTNLSSRYLDASGTSSHVQLVPSYPSPNGNSTIHDTYSFPRRGAGISQNPHYPLSNSPFTRNTERYYRENRNDFNLHHDNVGGIDYCNHTSIPCRVRPTKSNDYYRGYGTIDHSSLNYDVNRHRHSLPRSFSDCDLCKQHIFNEGYEQYYKEQDDNWRLGSAMERRVEPRTYRDRIKERFRQRSTVGQLPENNIVRSPSTTVEYSAVLPRHQRIASESNECVHHLPFEYIPNEISNNSHRIQPKRNLSQQRLSTGSNQHDRANNETGSTNFTRKFYERDGNNDDTKKYRNQCVHDAREIQEMSMRMNERQDFTNHQYYRQQQEQRRLIESDSNI